VGSGYISVITPSSLQKNGCTLEAGRAAARNDHLTACMPGLAQTWPLGNWNAHQSTRGPADRRSWNARDPVCVLPQSGQRCVPVMKVAIAGNVSTPTDISPCPAVWSARLRALTHVNGDFDRLSAISSVSWSQRQLMAR
jgi:hypothetical protein